MYTDKSELPIVDENSVIAREAVTQIQLLFVQNNFIFREQPKDDCGIDSIIELIENGQTTGKLLALQIKGSRNIKENRDGSITFYGITQKQVNYWLNYSLTVMFVVYNLNTKTAYWKIVDDFFAQKTEKNNLKIVLHRKITTQAIESIKQYAKEEVENKNTYSIIEQQDVSTSHTRRYTAKVLLNYKTSIPELKSLIVQIMNREKKEEYHLNESAKKHLIGKQAQVVNLHIALSMEDVNRSNWFCTSQWIDKNLSQKFSPIKINGEIIDDEITVKWNEYYEEIKNHNEEYTLSKQQYLQKLNNLLKELNTPTKKVIDLIFNYSNDAHCIEKLSKLENEIRKIYLDSGNIGLAPIECKDVSIRFRCMIAMAHNIVLPFYVKSAKENINIPLIEQTIKDYQKEMQKLEFELEKVNK